MQGWQNNTDHPPLPWLLEEENPSVRLRTLIEILNYAEQSPEVKKAKADSLQSAPLQTLLEKMHPDGYWLQKNPRTKEVVGEGVLYGSFASTHFCLAYLSELGADRTLPQVEKAADRYLSLQQPDGDFLGHYSCLLGYNIRTFARLGFQEDARVKLAMQLLVNTIRNDSGYLCDFHDGKYRSREVKSCIRGSVKALLAFSEFPDYWEHPRCKQLIDYFLRRGGIYKSRQPGVVVNYDMERLSFPITWRTNAWEILYALSKMGYGKDERLVEAWAALQERADHAGCFPLDWTPAQCPWKVGMPGEPNKWITFYVEAAKKLKVYND